MFLCWCLFGDLCKQNCRTEMNTDLPWWREQSYAALAKANSFDATTKLLSFLLRNFEYLLAEKENCFIFSTIMIPFLHVISNSVGLCHIHGRSLSLSADNLKLNQFIFAYRFGGLFFFFFSSGFIFSNSDRQTGIKSQLQNAIHTRFRFHQINSHANLCYPLRSQCFLILTVCYKPIEKSRTGSRLGLKSRRILRSSMNSRLKTFHLHSTVNIGSYMGFSPHHLVSTQKEPMIWLWRCFEPRIPGLWARVHINFGWKPPTE